MVTADSFQRKILESTPKAYDFLTSPGIAVLASVDGVEKLRIELGLASLEHSIPFTAETVSHSASIMKQFTAYAVALLLEDGQLNGNAKASTLLSDFPLCGADIAVDHLVHHTSGLRDQWDLLFMAGWRLDGDVITTDHIWKMIRAQEALNFAPGSEMLYSNTGYSVLARILEEVSGQSFPRVIESIVTPLGLGALASDDHQAIIRNRAYGYKLSSDKLGFTRNDINFANVGATSLFASARDLLAWAEHQNHLLLSDTRLGRRLNAPARTSDGKSIEYAYGQRVVGSDDRQIIFHDGWDSGYRAAIVRVPSRRLAVSLLTNGLEIQAIKIAFDAVESVLGTDEWRPERVKKLDAQPTPAQERIPSADIERRANEEELAGTYESEELSTEYYVRSDDGRLVLAHSRHPDSDLVPTDDPDVYEGPDWMPLIRFQATAGGVVGFDVTTSRIRGIRFTRVN